MMHRCKKNNKTKSNNTKCIVCLDDSSDRRWFRHEKHLFSKLNPDHRIVNKNAKLTLPPQKAAILSLFDAKGNLVQFCMSHAKDYVSVSDTCFNSYKQRASKGLTQRWYNLFDIDQPISMRKKSRKIEIKILQFLIYFKKFVISNSMPNPTGKGRFFDPQYDTITSVYKCFSKQLRLHVGKNVILPRISLPTFERMLKDNFKKIKLAKTVSACCTKCLKLETKVKALDSEIEVLKKVEHSDSIMQSELKTKTQQNNQFKLEQSQHHQSAKDERQFYSNRVQWLKQSNNDNKLVLNELYRTYRDNVLHLSIDAMQNKKYPTFTRHKEPSLYYFTKKITLYLLGVIDEGANRGWTYLYDERLRSTNSNHTISALFDVINTRLGSKRVLWINMDNCAVNKNRFVSIIL